MIIMKKNVIVILVIVGVIITLVGTAAAPVAVSAYESRPTYSLQEINNGALGDTITFNSIIYDSETDYDLYVEGMVTNETNFVGAREDTGINAGSKNVWNGTEITAEDGKTYIVRLYVHNNSPLGEAATAEDVKVRFDVPDFSESEVTINGWLTASNADPDTYMDDVTFKSVDGAPFHLEYVIGSAFLENGGFASGKGVQLDDNVVNQGDSIDDTWTLIGYEGFDGRIPGCYAYTNYVGIKVKVVYDYKFVTETKIRLADGEDKEWKDVVKAKIGDKVEFQIYYHNNSDIDQGVVAIRDILPSNLRYVDGSTKLMNAAYSDGTAINEDYLVTDGIRIGTYAKNAKAYVVFTAEVVDDDLAYGVNTLVNWGQTGIGSTILQDYAIVMVYNDLVFIIIFIFLIVFLFICIVAIIVLSRKMKRLKHDSEGYKHRRGRY